jgi:hypothetical protein
MGWREKGFSLAPSLWSPLVLSLRYLSFDFKRVKIKASAKPEERKVAIATQSVNRAVRDLQILS